MARSNQPRTTPLKQPRTKRSTPINVVVTDGRGRGVRAPGLAAWLARLAPKNAPRDISIALVSDAHIRALNRRYRRIDKVTDVLSFEPSDIAIAISVARRQAREAGHSYADELKVLSLHGLLHLTGYDHHTRSDRERMARLERRLRAKGGLRAGLIERAGGATERRGRPARARSASARSRRSVSGGGSAPATRQARARGGESEGRRPSDRK